jgi:hypothetical protein
MLSYINCTRGLGSNSIGNPQHEVGAGKRKMKNGVFTFVQDPPALVVKKRGITPGSFVPNSRVTGQTFNVCTGFVETAGTRSVLPEPHLFGHFSWICPEVPHP